MSSWPEGADWWATSISQILPGIIRLRGYPIEELIGNITFVDAIALLVLGELPTPARAHLLEAALVAAVDHGPQAPSIASARMAVTTGVALNNAVANGVNVLGDVHGGAGQQCMELYLAIDNSVQAGVILEAAVTECITKVREFDRFVPGFGHRFHPIDPRVAPLLDLVRESALTPEVDGRFVDIALAVESALSKGDRNIPMNIDGVTAVVFCELGIDPALGRGLFVLSRSVGILAHAWEEIQAGSRLKGPMPPSVLPTYTGTAVRHLG
jgi:citrate synthase